MSEKQILEGKEKIDKKVDFKKDVYSKEALEKPRKNEELEENEKDKIEKLQKQIKVNDIEVSKEEADLESKTSSIAILEKVEDQIQKLIEIASQEGPQKALKVAKSLNSNYALDKMHDRLIDEDEFRKVLIEKGFIEKTEI